MLSTARKISETLKMAAAGSQRLSRPVEGNETLFEALVCEFHWSRLLHREVGAITCCMNTKSRFRAHLDAQVMRFDTHESMLPVCCETARTLLAKCTPLAVAAAIGPKSIWQILRDTKKARAFYLDSAHVFK